NTASVAGFTTAPTQGLYNLSKHAVVAFSEALWHDLNIASEGRLRCSVLCPGYVKTGIVEKPKSDNDNLTRSQRISKQAVGEIVSTAVIHPQEVAEKVFEAIEDDRFYIFPDEDAKKRITKRMESIQAGENPDVNWFKTSNQIMHRYKALYKEFKGVEYADS